MFQRSQWQLQDRPCAEPEVQTRSLSMQRIADVQMLAVVYQSEEKGGGGLGSAESAGSDSPAAGLFDLSRTQTKKGAKRGINRATARLARIPPFRSALCLCWKFAGDRQFRKWVTGNRRSTPPPPPSPSPLLAIRRDRESLSRY